MYMQHSDYMRAMGIKREVRSVLCISFPKNRNFILGVPSSTIWTCWYMNGALLIIWPIINLCCFYYYLFVKNKHREANQNIFFSFVLDSRWSGIQSCMLYCEIDTKKMPGENDWNNVYSIIFAHFNKAISC